MPMGPIGGMPNSEIPTEAMKRLRPMLFFAVLGCTLSLIGKFIGREGSTAMTDIFPIVFGFLVLFSKNHANTCGMLFLLFSAMATLFAIYNLIFELAEKDTGGAHFFSADCEAKRDQISKSGAVIKVCSNEYIEGGSESCNKPFACADGSNHQPHYFNNGAYLYTKENVGQKLSIIFRDACTPYSVVGHIALIFSVFFNFMAAYMGWKIFEVTRQAFENPPEEEPLNDGQYDGGVRPPLRNNPASLFGGPMGPQQQGAIGQGTGGRSGGTPQQQQSGTGTGQQGAFTAFSGQGQRLGAS